MKKIENPTINRLIIAERLLAGACIHCGEMWNSSEYDVRLLICDYCWVDLNDSSGTRDARYVLMDYKKLFPDKQL